MIRGSVNNHRESIVRLRLRGPSGIEREVDALLDTGFTGAIALPPSIAHALALVRRKTGTAVMADGSIRQFDLFAAEVMWNGWQPVILTAVGNEALLGTAMLVDHQVRIEMTDGGAIEVTPL